MKKTFLISFSVAFFYFIFGKLTFFTMNENDIVTLAMFPPEGIALAFAIYFGKKALPGIFAGQFLLAITSNVNPTASFLISLVNTAEATIGIYMFSKLKINILFKDFSDYLKLFAISALILQPFSAFFGNMSLFLTHKITVQSLPDSIFSWWFGNTLAQIVFTPFILKIFNSKIDYLKFFGYALFYTVYMIIITLALQIQNPFILMTLSLSAVIYITVKEGTLYGWMCAIIASLIASYSIYLNIGAFSSYSQFDNTINYNFFILAHISMVIIIGVLFEKQKNFENTLKERIEEEIKKNQEQQILMFQQNKRAQMGDMINMIAHQWRQPLNNISLLSELITRGFQNNTLNEKTINYFKESSKKQIEYMSKTIDEFLNFFKEEKDKETADVNLILKSAVSMVEPTYKQKNIKINFETPKEGAFINTYPNKLLQVILNILNNAKDALHKKEQKEIFIKIKDTSDKIEISIEDTAGGIDKEIIEHIFDPYFSTKKDSGTGLGLYMTKVILKEQLNGDITVQNTEKGAKFTVTLNK